jgi:excisionase family DNA binding protein
MLAERSGITAACVKQLEAIRRDSGDYGFMERVTQRLSGAQGMPTRALIDIDELSIQLRIAKRTLYDWVHLRRIPFVKLGRALRLIL